MQSADGSRRLALSIGDYTDDSQQPGFNSFLFDAVPIY